MQITVLIQIYVNSNTYMYEFSKIEMKINNNINSTKKILII